MLRATGQNLDARQGGAGDVALQLRHAPACGHLFTP